MFRLLSITYHQEDLSREIPSAKRRTKIPVRNALAPTVFYLNITESGWGYTKRQKTVRPQFIPPAKYLKDTVPVRTGRRTGAFKKHTMVS